MSIPHIAVSIILMLIVLVIILAALGLVDIRPVFDLMETATS